MSMFGTIAVPPNGTHFLLIALVVVATLVGQLFALVRLPPLLVSISSTFYAKLLLAQISKVSKIQSSPLSFLCFWDLNV